MNRIRLPVCVLLGLLLSLLSLGGVAAAEADDGLYHGDLVTTTVWDIRSDADDSPYTSYRIPGIVVTKKDTVIVYCEARTGITDYSIEKGNDWCLMDIFIQRSEDGGETFGEPIYIARGTKEFAAVNNPVMIVGNDNTLHMLYCRNYSLQGGDMWYTKSTDDGLTWSEPVNVAQAAAGVAHDHFAFGPTHGICTRDGVLMVPVWIQPKGQVGGASHTYVFYSKDNGATWAMSERADTNTNETNIAELSDGSIILNSRYDHRLITTSKNGITGWTTTYQDEALVDPRCCAGLTAVDLPGLPYAHLFVNCASSVNRDHLTVRVSFDDCLTWEQPLLISEYEGGYSDIAVDSKGRVYVLYEVAHGTRDRLVRFSFVDQFLSEGSELRTTQQSEFLFRDESALGLLGRVDRLDKSVAEESLRFTAQNSKKYAFTLNLSKLSENINLNQKHAMVLRVRVNSQTEGNLEFGAYFQNGRLDTYHKEPYHSVTVPKDGQWHEVVMDLEEGGIDGMLWAIRFMVSSDTQQMNVGDSFDLASIRFYESADEARAALGLNAGGNDTATEPIQTEPERKGCGSTVVALMPMILIGAGLPLCLNGRKED